MGGCYKKDKKMKTLNKAIILPAVAVLSMMSLTQTVAAKNISAQQCQKWKQQSVRSKYAKDKYRKYCHGAKKRFSLHPKLAKRRVFNKRAKTKEELEKERRKRLERLKKLKAAKAHKRKAMLRRHKSSRSRFFFMQPKTRAYAGVSIGQSTLKPRIKATTNAGLDDSSDIGYKVFAGYQIKPWVAVEGFYAKLGDAKIHTANIAKGKVSYRLAGISGVLSKKLGSRLTVSAKAGYAKVGNRVSKGISYRKIKGNNIFAGLGLEFNITPRFTVKGEYESFDKDIKLLSTGVKFKF